MGEVIGVLILGAVAFGITIGILKWIAEVLGKAIVLFAKFGIPIFVLVMFSQVGAAEAATISVSAGSVGAALLASSLGV